MLEPEHRRFAETLNLLQPIASYEVSNLKPGGRFVMEWPANLTLQYQTTFFEGQYCLNRAWQEIPRSVFVGLNDTVRTRILRFALELKDDLGLASENLCEVPKEKIDQNITNYIYGGTNVIASRNFAQVDRIQIEKGDWQALADALAERLGVNETSVSELKSAIDKDSEETTSGLGKRTIDWLKQIGSRVGATGLSIGTEIVKKEATKWISEYLGLKS